MVSFIACTIRDLMIDNIFNNFNRQLIEDKELITVLNKDDMNKKTREEKAQNFRNVFSYQVPQEKTLGE